jgi:hypothetical protein
MTTFDLRESVLHKKSMCIYVPSISYFSRGLARKYRLLQTAMPAFHWMKGSDAERRARVVEFGASFCHFHGESGRGRLARKGRPDKDFDPDVYDDTYVNMELAIPRDGEGPEIARVTKRFRDANGLPIGVIQTGTRPRSRQTR